MFHVANPILSCSVLYLIYRTILYKGKKWMNNCVLDRVAFVVCYSLYRCIMYKYDDRIIGSNSHLLLFFLTLVMQYVHEWRAFILYRRMSKYKRAMKKYLSNWFTIKPKRIITNWINGTLGARFWTRKSKKNCIDAFKCYYLTFFRLSSIFLNELFLPHSSSCPRRRWY